MTIIPLSEGAFTIDQTKEFIPFQVGTDDLQQRTTGSLLVEIQPFVVQTSKDIILFDTGLGFSDASGQLQIHNNLLKNGIRPESVTKVLLSHLHKDHAGGIGMFNHTTRSFQLSFTNATYYVCRDELNLAMKGNNPSYKPENLDILSRSGQLYLLENEGEIDGYIHYETTAAHAPFHQVFRISENGQILFFGGDDAPQLQQMKSRFVAKYDHDGRKAMELRKKWWETANSEHWTMLFYHDIKTPLIRL